MKNPESNFSIEVVFTGKSFAGVSVELVKRVVFEAIEKSGVFLGKDVVITVGIVNVPLSEMQALNKTYRNKDAATDVLSFSEYPDRISIEQEKKKEISLGDVLLSEEVIRRQAHEDNVSMTHESVYLLAHGVLHLLGYDHEAEHFSIQDEICAILISKEENTNR